MATDHYIPLRAYLALLETHDWYYAFSDDSRKYTAGRESELKVMEIAKQSQPHMALYKAYMKHVFDGATKPQITEETALRKAEQAPPFNYTNFCKLVSDGKIFTVEFVKRSNGQLRKMTCRTGVKKRLRGGKSAYKPAEHNLLPVFDVQAKGYRSIPIDAIRSLTVSGQHFEFGGAA